MSYIVAQLSVHGNHFRRAQCYGRMIVAAAERSGGAELLTEDLQHGQHVAGVLIGNPREPMHIHVRGAEGEAKFWLKPEVRLAINEGFDAKALRELTRVVEQNTDLIEVWNDYFCQADSF